jgi:hypothetical protein
MRIQSSHTIDERGLDAYFTCVEAVEALILLEGSRLPQRIWEPAAGDGAIVKALRASGRTVHASDIADYGLPGCHIMDYLSAPKMPAAWVYGVVTNPPYRRAQAFAGRALAEVPYVALLLRTNFLMDAERRGRWLDRNEPTRTYYLLPRLPMMHREGYQGKKSSSNTPFTWVVWQECAPREFPAARLLARVARNPKAEALRGAGKSAHRTPRRARGVQDVSDLGISHDQSSQWQQLAEIDEAEFYSDAGASPSGCGASCCRRARLTLQLSSL